jgi:hypothetical protein
LLDKGLPEAVKNSHGEFDATIWWHTSKKATPTPPDRLRVYWRPFIVWVRAINRPIWLPSKPNWFPDEFNWLLLPPPANISLLAELSG